MGSTRFWLGLPVVVLALIVALLLLWRPLDRLTQEAPPVEEAAIERVNLTPGMSPASTCFMPTSRSSPNLAG